MHGVFVDEYEVNQAYIESIKKEIGFIETNPSSFSKLVDHMASGDKPAFYFNACPFQTRIVVSKIIDIAKTGSFLNIFMGDVNCEFYGINLLKKLEEVQLAGCNVSIVLAENPVNDIAEYWKELIKKNISISYFDEYDETLNHICYTDDAYRVEAPHKKLRPDEQVSELSPIRPARFGFHRHDDVAAVNEMWKRMATTQQGSLKRLE